MYRIRKTARVGQSPATLAGTALLDGCEGGVDGGIESPVEQDAARFALGRNVSVSP
jgi:hypothetical protein